MAEAEGQIEKEDGVLVLKRIHVVMKLRSDPEHRAAIERVFGVFAGRCPVYRSLKAAIEITCSLQME